MEDLRTWLPRAHLAFRHYNRFKQDLMRHNAPEAARVILDLLPLCLHLNHPDLPGYLPDSGCPCGIRAMEWPVKAPRVIESMVSGKLQPGELQAAIPRHREIEGLFTIGSVGSIGQTRQSDYDIWVVVEAESLGAERFEILHRKLKHLELWLSSTYLVEVHFFLMDVRDIQINNFGQVSHEGAGSALRHVLKEEFYRTMTLIEGRVPLWWVCPPGLNDEDYSAVGEKLRSEGGLDPDDFIDLGNLTGVPAREFLGTALWQMHKALDDPLKSVLKMALVATHLESEGPVELLCDQLKAQVYKAKPKEIVDPYLAVFNAVEEYYQRQSDPVTVDLMRKCFFLKVSPTLNKRDLLKLERDDKASILVDLISAWGWSWREFEHLSCFDEWSMPEYRALGDQVHRYLMQTAVKLVRTSRTASGSELLLDEELNILKRRVESIYVAKPGKIAAERYLSHEEPAYSQVYFSHDGEMWHLSETATQRGTDNVSITSAPRVATLAAWLVYNRRFNPSTSFHMVPNATDVSLVNMQDMLSRLCAAFKCGAVGLNREDLAKQPYPRDIFVAGNLERPGHLSRVDDIDLIYRSSWNELYTEHLTLADLRSWVLTNKQADTSIALWVPRTSDAKRLAQSLVNMLT